VKADEAG